MKENVENIGRLSFMFFDHLEQIYCKPHHTLNNEHFRGKHIYVNMINVPRKGCVRPELIVTQTLGLIMSEAEIDNVTFL